MRKSTMFLSTLALGIGGAISESAPSLAVPITYTEQATASGSLNGVSFTNASIVFTMDNNTATVIGAAPHLTNTGTLTLHVAGFPTASFTDITIAAVNQSTSKVSPNSGFGDDTESLAILFTMNSSFSSYDLRTAIGPLSGAAVFNAGDSFPTTGGAFILNAVSGDATFTATIKAVPVPTPGPVASLMLLGIGLAGIGIRYRG